MNIQNHGEICQFPSNVASFPSQEAGQTTSSVGEEGRSGGLPTIGQAFLRSR